MHYIDIFSPKPNIDIVLKLVDVGHNPGSFVSEFHTSFASYLNELLSYVEGICLGYVYISEVIYVFIFPI